MPIEVSIDQADLVVRFTGWDVVWTLRRGARAPLAHVVRARVGDRATEVRTLSLRLGGTYVPRVLTAGLSRSKGGGRQLWNAHRAPDGVLIVDLREERWDRLVLEVPDPRATAERIEAARSG